jgi:Helix-turn-helix domain
MAKTPLSAASGSPATENIMTNVQTVRVLFHPRRLKIIEALEGPPRTVKQIAAELKTNPTKLYYHIKLLEAHHLIQVVDTRVVSGIIEKQYQVAAHHYILDPSLHVSYQNRQSALETLLSSIWDETKRDIRNSVEDGSIDLSDQEGQHHSLMIRRHLRRLTSEQAVRFYARLRALFEEFDVTESGRDRSESALYAFALAFYPTHSRLRERKHPTLQREPPANPDNGRKRRAALPGRR